MMRMQNKSDFFPRSDAIYYGGFSSSIGCLTI